MNEVVLDNWVVRVRRFDDGRDDFDVEITLAGDVTGHPKLQDGPITTSLVKRWIGNSVQTANTRYTLKNFAGDGGATWKVLLEATNVERAWFNFPRDMKKDPIKEESK
jgi:hypothetical protein